jgi:hypothetical protein
VLQTKIKEKYSDIEEVECDVKCWNI